MYNKMFEIFCLLYMLKTVGTRAIFISRYLFLNRQLCLQIFCVAVNTSTDSAEKSSVLVVIISPAAVN